MYKKIFEEYFEKNMPLILDDLKEIIGIQSIAEENSDIKPFGAGSAKALAWGENFMKKLGMTTRNFDNYAVRGDFSQDKAPRLAVLAHLDTVPAGEGWTTDPFTLTLKDDVLYGRGTIDDKGPAVAALWAAKAIKDLNIPVENFRIIFGGNEENGCEDMEYYEKCEAFPENVFTPDGSFPVLNCEKGMVHLTFEGEYSHAGKYICELNAGTVINAVPGKAEVTFCGVTRAEVENAFADFEGIKLETEDSEKGVKCVVIGHSAHGSRPERGYNTATAILQACVKMGFKGLENLSRIFPHGELDGKSAGLGFSDEISGAMTTVLTLLSTDGKKLCGGIDIRFPIDRKYNEISSIISKAIENAGYTITSCDGMESHYVDENSNFVQTLLKVYENVKGEKGYCIAEGGITYVHNTEGAVAFGAEFPDENNNMHGADEHITMETFKYNLNMYANALYELLKK